MITALVCTYATDIQNWVLIITLIQDLAIGMRTVGIIKHAY